MYFPFYRLTQITNINSHTLSFLAILGVAFQIWMLIDCIRERRDFWWFWIILAWGIGPAIYFLYFRPIPAALGDQFIKRQNLKKRVRELESKIHNIDNAYHRTELGNVYLGLEKWDLAQKEFEAALERDPRSLEAKVHLGYALLALNKPAEAWPLLETGLNEKPDVEYGELFWQSAKCQTALGNLEQARYLYERLFKKFGYAKAQFEYADILSRLGDPAESRKILEKIIADAPHAPSFQQRKERSVVRQARRALATMKA